MSHAPHAQRAASVAVLGHAQAAETLRAAGVAADHYPACPGGTWDLSGYELVVLSDSSPVTAPFMRLELVDRIHATPGTSLLIVATWPRLRYSLRPADDEVLETHTTHGLLRHLGLPTAGIADEPLVADVPARMVRPTYNPVTAYKAVELWASEDGKWTISGPFAGWPAPLDHEARCPNPEHADVAVTPDPNAGCVDGFSAYLEPQGARAWDGDRPWPVATVELYGRVMVLSNPRHWTELNAQRQRVVAVEISDCSCGHPAVGFRRGTWYPDDRDWEALPSCEACADGQGLLDPPFPVTHRPST